MVTPSEILTAVDELPDAQSGALLIEKDGSPLGSVLVEARRVCWAVANQHGRRLRDLLRRYSAITLTDAELEKIVLACRAEGRPLGETLVDRGHCSEEAMRAALRQHTIESLVTLCSTKTARMSFIGHRHGSYRPSFTMAPVMLLAAIGAHLEGGEELETAELGLSEIAPEGVIAASFLLGSSGPVLVHAEHADGLGVRGAGALGNWVSSAFQACEGFSRRALAHGIEHANGTVALGWRSSRRVLHAAVIEERTALMKAWTALEGRGHPAVLSQHKNMISARRESLGAVVNVNG